ncbi:MAG TPA: hypothetical protein VF188_16020 [Longimicrobiales bacterium]
MAEDTPSIGADSVTVAASPDSVRDRFVQHGLRPIGSSRREIIASLGEPDSIQAEPVANRYVPGQTDTIFELSYDGLTATIYHVSGGRDILSEVVVSDNRHLRDPAVRIGMPWPEVRRRLGEPWDASDSTFTYQCLSCMGADAPVNIYVRDGVVTAIEFAYYVD